MRLPTRTGVCGTRTKFRVPRAVRALLPGMMRRKGVSQNDASSYIGVIPAGSSLAIETTHVAAQPDDDTTESTQPGKDD